MITEVKLDEPAQASETLHRDTSVSMPCETSDKKGSGSQGCEDSVSSYLIGRVSFRKALVSYLVFNLCLLCLQHFSNEYGMVKRDSANKNVNYSIICIQIKLFSSSCSICIRNCLIIFSSSKFLWTYYYIWQTRYSSSDWHYCMPGDSSFRSSSWWRTKLDYGWSCYSSPGIMWFTVHSTNCC